MKKIVWRLKEQPTAESLQGLVLKGILTKDEARQILFSSETEEDRDKKSLESEIKFLRELVEKLARGNSSRIVEVIREVKVPVYRQYPWWNPYDVWCHTVDSSGAISIDGANLTGQASSDNTVASNFSQINTF